MTNVINYEARIKAEVEKKARLRLRLRLRGGLVERS